MPHIYFFNSKSIAFVLKHGICFSVSEPFFNPVVNISFVEIKYLSNALDACTCIICVFIARCLISSEYSRVFGVKCVVFFSVCSRTIFSLRLLGVPFYHRADTCVLLLLSLFSYFIILHYALFVHTFRKKIIDMS